MPAKTTSLSLAVVGLTVCLYAGTVSLGLHLHRLPNYELDALPRPARNQWQPPQRPNIPNNPLGDSIRRGELIFDETPLYAAAYANAKVSCGSCHEAGGIKPYASPVVGAPAAYPAFSQRAGHTITLQDRIQECFVRSENGRPIPYDGLEMRALVDYITWLSAPQPDHKPFVGRGLVRLKPLAPDPVHGGAVYAAQCAGCHGGHGEGKLPVFPPVWGPDSFNDGAGTATLPKLAAFVQHNMPQNRMGILTTQESYDVAEYIRTQPRPAFNQAYKNY